MRFVVIEATPELSVSNGSIRPVINAEVISSLGDLEPYLREVDLKLLESDFDNEIRFETTDGRQIIIKDIDGEMFKSQTPAF